VHLQSFRLAETSYEVKRAERTSYTVKEVQPQQDTEIEERDLLTENYRPSSFDGNAFSWKIQGGVIYAGRGRSLT